MTEYEIYVGLDNEGDFDLIKRLIENMKGVLYMRLKKSQEIARDVREDKSSESSFDRLEALRRSYDSSYIDMNDERTRYILSK